MEILTEKIHKKTNSASYKDRIIGKIEGKNLGPTIIALAGIHGNEPTGIKAIEHVLQKIQGLEAVFKGVFIGIRGNLEALNKQQRFIDEDMNRIWFTSILDKVRRTPYGEVITAERRETKEVLEIIDPIILNENKSEPVIFADLHTFSSDKGLFVICPKTEVNESALNKLNVPVIFGIEKALHGTALKYVNNAGNIGFAFEAGKHFSKNAEFNATAGLYKLLSSSGCLNPKFIPDFDEYESFLEVQIQGLPPKVEFVYKHIIEKGDDFEMRPGFQNFDKIKKGDWLANDKLGKIEAQANGYILMPLYQEKGEDGFFIVKELE